MITKIYVLCELDGEIRYIGKTYQSLEKRLMEHIYEARNQRSKNHRCYWVRSILSSGYLPKIQLIGEVEGDGSKEEIAWIAYGKTEGWRLVNGTDGGEGKRGCKASIVTRRKLCAARKRRIFSKETCRRISKSLNGHIVSKEVRRKLSEAQRGSKAYSYGRPVSEEVRKKLSIASKGHIISEETRKKMSMAQIGHKGFTPSLEVRQKISIANKGKRRSKEFCLRMKKLHTGKKLSAEHCHSIGESQKGHHNSQETIQKMSKARIEYWRKRKESKDNSSK